MKTRNRPVFFKNQFGFAQPKKKKKKKQRIQMEYPFHRIIKQSLSIIYIQDKRESFVMGTHPIFFLSQNWDTIPTKLKMASCYEALPHSSNRVDLTILQIHNNNTGFISNSFNELLTFLFFSCFFFFFFSRVHPLYMLYVY